MIEHLLTVVMAATPTPDPEFNPDTVTPGWIGFTAMFLVVVATLLLMFDMVRRVRRTRYRGEIQERLEAERLAADLPASKDGSRKDEAQSKDESASPSAED